MRNPIDRFILAGLEALGLEHSPPASRVALIRRVTFDLAGRPAFATKRSRHSWVISDPMPTSGWSIGCSPARNMACGWGQHWLDLAHYADTNGFELDAERPDAWRYRDWVVRSLNVDCLMIDFSRSNWPATSVKPGDHDALVATGFCRCGPREVVGGNVIPEVKRQNELSEITGTVGSVFLGLTIGCARCHDHKFDAIPTTDYYRLQSFFATSELNDVSIADKAERDRFAAAPKQVQEQGRPAQEAARGTGSSVPAGAQGGQDDDVERRRACRAEHTRSQAHARSEKAGEAGSIRRCESRGRKWRRPYPPTRPTCQTRAAEAGNL